MRVPGRLMPKGGIVGFSAPSSAQQYLVPTCSRSTPSGRARQTVKVQSHRKRDEGAERHKNGARSHAFNTVNNSPTFLGSSLPDEERILPTSSIDKDLYEPVGTADFASALCQHPITQLLMERRKQGTVPGARAKGDTAKLGLVVEGGGMRGIVSGAMLMALDALGMTNCFDSVYGASAGAINLTYFLSGQRHGLEIYTQDLSGNNFIDFTNFIRGGPLMNLDYLIDHVMHTVRPLDWHKVMHSPVPLKVVASSLDTLRPMLLENWSSKSDLVECLKASATVPQIAGPPRPCRGHRLVDAAIFEPVPLRTAMRDGCTHVLVLCTRPATLHTTWRKAVRGTVVRVVKRTMLNAPYMKAAWSSESSEQLASQDEELVSTLAAPPDETRRKLGAYVLPVYPESAAGVNPVTTDPTKLRRAEAEGWHAISSLFTGQDLFAQHRGPFSNSNTNSGSTWRQGKPQPQASAV